MSLPIDPKPMSPAAGRVFRIAPAAGQETRPAPRPAPAPGATLINFDISDIRGAMAARRKKRAIWLAARLFAFVALPTAVASYWFSNHATPIYASHSEFILQSQDRQTPAAGMPAMASALGGNQDAIALQGYLKSKEAFLALDINHNLRAHLTNEDLDLWHRISSDATDEDIYEAWRKLMKVSFDPTEGVTRMEIRSFDPELSRVLSEDLLFMAEERVDRMTVRLREDAVSSLMRAVDEQTKALGSARARLLEVQSRSNALSGAMEGELIQSQLASLEAELSNARLTYASITSNKSPYPARVDAAQQKIAMLEQEISKLRARISGSGEGQSVAATASEIAAAELDIETRLEVLRGTIANLEAARADAIKQSRYLAVSVKPLTSDDAVFPDPILNTLATFLSLIGIYLVSSLSISLVRDYMRR